jgi:hypothetical protein
VKEIRTMNGTLRLGKVIRTLGLMGIMMALAGMMAYAPSASAGSSAPALSTVIVNVVFPDTGSDSNSAEVSIADPQGNSVAYGTTDSAGRFVAKVAPGNYKLTVHARGYSEHIETFRVGRTGTVTLKVFLDE